MTITLLLFLAKAVLEFLGDPDSPYRISWMDVHQHPHLLLLNSRAAYLLCNSIWEGKVGWGRGEGGLPATLCRDLFPFLHLLSPFLLPDGKRL